MFWIGFFIGLVGFPVLLFLGLYLYDKFGPSAEWSGGAGLSEQDFEDLDDPNAPEQLDMFKENY